ncbi:FG-GAP repeat domain-containing protein [Streptomyces sp. NPDC088757]|uniref:FG-GAP repeat domain-containing protein n=1 Tax=Streptomyces sp. NPDC088757 TaxID=3365889 RepID=UPI003815EDBF
MINNRRRRALRGALVATAVTVAAATAAGTAFAAGAPDGADRARVEAAAAHQAAKAPKAGAFGSTDEVVNTPTFIMNAVNKKTNKLHMYFPNFQGGFEPAEVLDYDYSTFADWIDVDNDLDGFGEASYVLYKNGKLDFLGTVGEEYVEKNVGTGWHIYSTVLSPGSLGGAKEADLIGVDKAGVLWSYLSYPDGRLTPRTKVGGGWQAYNQIAGQGDLTGDGKADIVAKDTSGVLWLYKGTGNYKAPFAARVKVGAGWNIYDRLLSVGDLDSDGKADLIARKTNGELYRYSGTGSAAAPFAKPVKIGFGYQGFNLL